jgi:hypothetical protein
MDSTNQGDFQIKFTLDSLFNTYNNILTFHKTKVDLLSAQVIVTYTEFGKEVRKTFLDGEKKMYSFRSGDSNDEKLFELPVVPICIGGNWDVQYSVDNCVGSVDNKKISNKLIGFENKNGHDCYRIDFMGDIINIAIQDDYKQTDSGVITGTYWIDKQKNIIIAVESSTKILKSLVAHPGYSGPSPIKGSSFKSVFEIIE